MLFAWLSVCRHHTVILFCWFDGLWVVYLSVGLCMFSWCFMGFCLLVRVIILLLISVVVYAWQGLWVGITHSPTRWHFGEWQRTCRVATLEVLARPPASRQCRLSAVSAGLTLAQRWTGNTVTALSTLAVSAASARRRPTAHDGWPRGGGIYGGGGVARILSYMYTLIAKPAQ